MKRNPRVLVCVILLVVVSGTVAQSVAASEAGALDLPEIFGDRMVLQRQLAVPVWGRSAPQVTVTVSIAGQRQETRAGDDGAWLLRLDPLEAGGPHEMVVEAEGETIRFEDVLVGEVWLAAGQSNMEMPLAGWGRILDYETEIARADYPEIRLFKVPRATAVQPLADVAPTEWSKCSPEAVEEFSSTAYFFGRRIYRETGVPIGLINSSWGGTVAEAWTSAGSLAELDDFRGAVEEIQAVTAGRLEEMRVEYEQAREERNRAVAEDDEGLDMGSPAWVMADLDDSNWQTMAVPSKWEDEALPDLDGVVWFRRTVEVPESWAGRELVLHLGPIDDTDETFFNGVLVGKTEQWDLPRSYPVPARLVRPGSNLIAVRVLDTYLAGGIWGEAGDLRLESPGAGEIPLAGPWAYRVGLELEPLPMSPDDPNLPTVLHNGMIRPLAPFGLRGVIWYQGESNSSRAYQYRALFRTMIQDWRELWGQGDIPFYFVQLAAFEPGILERDKWPELREAQAMALSLPETGMAVAIDIGNPKDVHPKNKQEVGNRLARLALHRLYGQEVPDSGPVYQSMSREGARIRLTFDHSEGGLEAKPGALTGFTIAGEDRQFHPAEVRIENDAVVLWSDDVADPVAARYGWEDAPDCNLYNGVGLPAAPFRTDDWPGLTEGR